MIRLPLLIATGAAAIAAAATPAIIGLSNNPSFSEQLPVRVPARASVATFPTNAVTTLDRAPKHDPKRDVMPSPKHREAEPGDDHHRDGDRQRGRHHDDHHRGDDHRGDDSGRSGGGHG